MSANDARPFSELAETRRTMNYEFVLARGLDDKRYITNYDVCLHNITEFLNTCQKSDAFIAGKRATV